MDFALFGPHQRRFIKKLTLSAQHYVPGLGLWRTSELPGPTNFQQWWKSWQVYKDSMLMLGAVDPAHLDNYAELIRNFDESLGQPAGRCFTSQTSGAGRKSSTA